ncbi:CBS domain-containing protein [Halomonas sp. ZH2S]|uniref:CBS domain-containing protein n=1 Tax=Vreelandella zhuhanensis TaxID=2684210 RepID=A0A7X3KR84_9GAMM|nr:CBS domain-containing protein [Halomonas zhuhanensis]MWJ29295.1 CBS domain-containing protein [Halomonas zhuhanensis]
MQAKEAMTTRPKYLNTDASIREVAELMRDTDSGFEPLVRGDKVEGVLTDRDITIRGIAEGKRPEDNAIDIATQTALYTFSDTDVLDVLKNMQEQQVQRLLVLKSPDQKDLVGIITVGDIADHCKDDAAVSKELINCAKHYR